MSSKELQLPYFIVDAFTRESFSGNPAGVCLLEDWLPDNALQKIASENNQPETAFICPTDEDDIYEIRWFSPVCEVPLCGHATLAASYVLFDLMEELDELEFRSQTGSLRAFWHDDGSIALDFPALAHKPSHHKLALEKAFGVKAEDVIEGEKHYVAILASQEDVKRAKPDLEALKAMDKTGFIITAPAAKGGKHDIVSRCFFPAEGIPEDQVTGSAHCLIVPYWAEKMGKNIIHAKQLSARGGEIECAVAGDRVHLSGHAVLYLEGRIVIKLQ